MAVSHCRVQREIDSHVIDRGATEKTIAALAGFLPDCIIKASTTLHQDVNQNFLALLKYQLATVHGYRRE